MIYFIQAGENGPIKIGVTNDAGKRIYELQTGHYETLSIIGLSEGGRDKEIYIHNLLADYRLVREWFKPAPEVLDFIKKNSSPYSGDWDSPKRKGVTVSASLPKAWIGQLRTKAGDDSISAIVRRLLEKYAMGEVGLE